MNAEGQCVIKDGVLMDDIPMPPGIVGKSRATEFVSIVALTSKTEKLVEFHENDIKELLKVCYRYLNWALDGKMTCKATSSQKECFAILPRLGWGDQRRRLRRLTTA